MTTSDSVESIAQDLYTFLADRFPVCCWSDEFIFFPQALPGKVDWSRWDDLSPDCVQDTVQKLRSYCGKLAGIDKTGPDQDPEKQISISLLYRLAEILEEQFEHVGHHVVQPTFILMIAIVGLVQASQVKGSDALGARIKTLPEFLNRFRADLEPLPDLYRQAGIRMGEHFCRWLPSLAGEYDLRDVLSSAYDFVERLRSSPEGGSFLLERDTLERVVSCHMGSGLGLSDCIRELEEEISQMTVALELTAASLKCGRNWESAYGRIPMETFLKGEKKLLLKKEITRLRQQCIREGFPGLEGSGDLESLDIEPLPESLSPVRSTDSYNARPGSPYSGGVFYIFSDSGLGHASDSMHPVYRMTAAHETYPGHHLLDMCRWNNTNLVRRPVEFPLFYEGWACFGEELMFECGAFEREYDKLILARRRYRHAVRGKVDLLLHMGELDLDSAAVELEKAGFQSARAAETVRKYALRPAYQICYTIGCRRFRKLFQTHGSRGVGPFAGTVLGQGEILFEDLERVLENRD